MDFHYCNECTCMGIKVAKIAWDISQTEFLGVSAHEKKMEKLLIRGIAIVNLAINLALVQMD